MNEIRLPRVETFIKLMMMSTSSNDNEALSALRHANAMLAAANNNWEDFVRGKVKMEPGLITDPFAGAPDPTGKTRPRSGGGGNTHTDETEINGYFEKLLVVNGGVKTGFRTFVESVYEWWEEKGFLTEKQYETIKKAATR